MFLAELRRIRRAEALAAAHQLGVSEEQVHFLEFPEGQLSCFSKQFELSLDLIFQEICPTFVFIPFRFDKHKDHLGVNRSVNNVTDRLQERPTTFEYFVYYRSRILPGGDIRKFIYPKYMIKGKITGFETQKRCAISRHESQVTCYYNWQSKPVLSDTLVHEFVRGPEIFVTTDPAPKGAKIFSRFRLLIKFTHSVEPILKRFKDKIARSLRALVRALR